MTAQQHRTIRTINDSHAAERFIAAQAGREVSAQARRDAALERAGELAQLGRLAESKRVLELNYFEGSK